jgi:hypothetical protein
MKGSWAERGHNAYQPSQEPNRRRFQWYVARQVTPPLRDHAHTEQEERLEVPEGTVRCRVAGIDRLLQRGQGAIIPFTEYSGLVLIV